MSNVRATWKATWAILAMAVAAGSAWAVEPDTKGGTGAAAPTAPLMPLPSAESVIKKFVEATGGEAAYEKVKSRVTRGTMTINPPGITFKIVSTQRLPDKMVVSTSSEEIGETKSGYNGQVAWETSAVNGARILEGSERDEAVRRASLLADAHPEKFFKTLEVTGSEVVGEEDCWVVKMTPATGEPAFNLYSKQTGLIVQSRSTIQHQMGPMTMTANLSDYREVEGVKIPHKVDTRLKGMPIKMTMVLDKVENNTVADDAAFELPADIKELLEEQKKEGADPKHSDPKQPEPKPAPTPK